MSIPGKFHELKTWPEYFEAIKRGAKTFEIRKNDRNFAVGDVLLLRKYCPHCKSYLGDSETVIVNYVLKEQPYVSSEYVVMSIQKVAL